MKKTVLTLCVSFLLFLCGCQNNTKTDKLTVGVSIPPQKEFVQAVCGDTADVFIMIPAGASAENYEPTPKEIAALSDSDIYFSIGVPAEENGILPHIPNSVKTCDLTKKVAEYYPDIKIGNERDPHIWLSPKRTVIMVEEIAEQMSKIDPDNESFYRTNADTYIKKLNDTENQIETILESKDVKTFYIAHPSYGYFAADFGLNMVELEKNGHEATAKDLTEIINSAKADVTKVIFTQEEVSKSLAELVAKEIGGSVDVLSPLSENYSDNLLETARKIARSKD